MSDNKESLTDTEEKNIDCFEEIKTSLEYVLTVSENQLKIDIENDAYQSLVVTTSNSLSSLFQHVGLIEIAKKHLKRSIELCNKKIEADPHNLAYKLDRAKAIYILRKVENFLFKRTLSKDSESVQKTHQKTTSISSYENNYYNSLVENIELIKQTEKEDEDYESFENLYSQLIDEMKSFNPEIFYNNWKLTIKFDSKKVKGKLTIKIGATTFFDRQLTEEEAKYNEIEIDLRERKYFPKGKEFITFEIPNHMPIIKEFDYFETIDGKHKTRILQHDCCGNLFTGKNLRIAAVQLKYNAYKENSVVKIMADEAYHRKILAVLKALRGETDIIVFPEFSIPFDFLEEIQQFSDENRIIVVAGSHYVIDENIEKYGKLFIHEFEEADLLKNVSPIVIPSSKIVHNEKYLGARIEEPVFFEDGMEPGEINHIFKLQENLNIGILICYEFLNTELRHRLVPICNVILVPQTNPKPQSFYEMALNDINRPLGGGNTAFVMANGIFTVDGEKGIQGGYTGIALTLDKHSKTLEEEGIIFPVGGSMEQLVFLASINTDYFPAWEGQVGQVPITTRLIHIFEESEILRNPEGNGKEFIELIRKINSCENREKLRELLEKNRRDLKNSEDADKGKEKSLIEQYSPLMNKHIQGLLGLKGP